MSQIILKNVGRGKVNRTIEVEHPQVTPEEAIRQIEVGANSPEEWLSVQALREVKKHVASSEVWLEPDEEKGEGFWKVYVGMGYHVGDVEIKV